MNLEIELCNRKYLGLKKLDPHGVKMEINLFDNHIRLQNICLCENVIVDVKNRFSLINIFDQITFEKLPSLFSCYYYFCALFDAGHYKIALKQRNSKGEEKELFVDEIEKSETAKHSTIVQLQLGIEIAGTNSFNIYINDKIIYETILTIKAQDDSNSK